MADIMQRPVIFAQTAPPKPGREQRLRLIRAENEARYQREIAEREDCDIAYISLATVDEVKEQLTEWHNQPIEIKEA